MAGELFKMMAGIDMVHVPYRSSAAALTDLLGGQVQMLFSPLPSSIEYVRTGRLRALATTGGGSLRRAAGHPHRGGFLTGLRGEGLVWCLRSKKHDRRDCR